MLILVSDKGTVLLSELGSGTNTTAAYPPGVSGPGGASTGPQIDGGGSAEGNRGSGDSPASTETGFQQGGKSQASSFREIGNVIAIWSGIMALVVGGMFTLL